MAEKMNKPTDAELEILRVLWQRGPSTVRQVHRALSESKGTSYNTTLKLMQIMLDKGVLTRDESQRPQVYSASQPRDQMQKRLVRDFVQRVFGGSARKLLAAITPSDISADELSEIKRLLGKVKGKQ